MKDFKNIRTIIFDYDGTLHNSIKIYAPAFLKAYDFLVKHGYAEERCWTEKEISYWLGFNSQDMWRTFMPNLPQEIMEQSSSIIGEEMRKLVVEGKSVLYDGAIETLEYLKERAYILVFLSNCKIYYRDAHNKTFGLSSFFADLVCSEEHSFIPKYEILRKIRTNYPEKLVIVGDRGQDMEAGSKNGIYTVGCSYGFASDGELDNADIIINDIRDLKKYFR